MDGAVLAGAGGVLATATLWLVARWLGALRASWRAKYRTRRALARERDAEDLLRGQGYRIVERQVHRRYRIRRDGDAFEVELRADLIVRRDGRRWVADVKTGREAPRLTTAATRRQLLEYRVAYDVDGVLLVDMEAGAVHAVDFDLANGKGRRIGGGWTFACGLVLGAMVVWLAGDWVAENGFAGKGASTGMRGVAEAFFSHGSTHRAPSAVREERGE
jgi:hypothetical protein